MARVKWRKQGRQLGAGAVRSSQEQGWEGPGVPYLSAQPTGLGLNAMGHADKDNVRLAALASYHRQAW